MSIPPRGVPLSVLTFRGYAALGVAPWTLLTQTIADPLLEGQAPPDRAVSRLAARLAEARWPLEPSDRNIQRYAAYFASGIRGELTGKWSVPPLGLWSPAPLTFPEADVPTGWLPPAAHLTVVEGEAAVAALYRISANPGRYGLVPAQVTDLLVSFEIYWDITAADARQIFRDRNL